MTTIDLSRSSLSAEELVKLAARGSVEIITAEGRTFLLEETGDFGKQESPAKSKKFRRVRNDRSEAPATISFEDYRRSLP